VIDLTQEMKDGYGGMVGLCKVGTEVRYFMVDFHEGLTKSNLQNALYDLGITLGVKFFGLGPNKVFLKELEEDK
jgi:hypothetical protein